MKDPAFLFYPNDWIGGTMGMTFEEKGAYVELLITQFNRGHMTSHMIGRIVGQLWDNIKDKFEVDPEGLYFNRRLEIEQIKRKDFTKSRRNNLSGNNQYTNKSKNKGGHTTSRMEDVNENRNKDIVINKGIEDRKQAFISKCIDANTQHSIDKNGEVILSEHLLFDFNDGFAPYWTEHGEKDKKMKFEKQKSFDIALRMHKWKRNSEKFNKTKNQNGQISTEQIIDNFINGE